MNTDEHGIAMAFYNNSPLGYRPTLECACGFETSNACLTWQEAGEEFDAHLAVVPPGAAQEPPK